MDFNDFSKSDFKHFNGEPEFIQVKLSALFSSFDRTGPQLIATKWIHTLVLTSNGLVNGFGQCHLRLTVTHGGFKKLEWAKNCEYVGIFSHFSKLYPDSVFFLMF